MDPQEPARPGSNPPPRTGSLPPPSLPPMRGLRPDGREVSLPPMAVAPEPPSEPQIGWLAQAAARADCSPEKPVTDQLAARATWAATTEEQAARVTARFWLLKGPAFVCAAGASTAEWFGFGRA